MRRGPFERMGDWSKSTEVKIGDGRGAEWTRSLTFRAGLRGE